MHLPATRTLGVSVLTTNMSITLAQDSKIKMSVASAASDAQSKPALNKSTSVLRRWRREGGHFHSEISMLLFPSYALFIVDISKLYYYSTRYT